MFNKNLKANVWNPIYLVVLVIVVLLCSVFNSFAQFKTIYIDTLTYKNSTVDVLDCYNRENIVIKTNHLSIYNGNQLKLMNGEILRTNNQGLNWDTLKYWFWDFEHDIQIKEYPNVVMAEYFNKDRFCMMNKSGDFENYDLSKKTVDTIRLFDSNSTTYSGVVYWSHYDSLIYITSWLNDANKFSTNMGKDWKIIYKPQDTLLYYLYYGLYSPSYLAIKPNNQIFQFYGMARANTQFGYIDSLFDTYSVNYNIDSKKYSLKRLEKEAFFYNPQFINDSVGFVSSEIAYFKDDNIPSDSLFRKPAVFKTQDGGMTWKKVFESQYFIGYPGTDLFIKGDTIILSYLNTYSSMGLIKSYDFGKTWEIEDISHFFPPEKYRIKSFRLTSPDEALVNIKINVPDKNVEALCILDLNYISSAEDPKLFLPEMKLYPNPANNFITIDFEASGAVPTDVRLFDMMGTELKSSDIYKSNGSVMIGTGNLPVGTYLAHIYLGETLFVKSFVIAR